MKKTTFLLLFAFFIAKNGNTQPDLIWEKKLGGSKSEFFGNVIPTSDGNWLFSTAAASSDGDLVGNAGQYDIWILKTDTLGNIIWSKSFGGSEVEGGGGLAENSDGSFWAIGSTSSTDGIFSASKGTIDVFLLKISAAGDLIFAKTFGGSGHDNFQDFVPTDDGGLLFVASSWSNSGSGDVVFNHGDRDCWLVKLDADGQIEWQKSIGGSKHEVLCQLEKTKNGGFWLSVRSESSNGDFPQISGANNTWVLKLDDAGTVLWQRQIAQENNFVYPEIKKDAGENLVLMMGLAADWRTYLLKFDENGNKFFEKAISEAYPDDHFEGFEPAADGGFFFFGRDSSVYPMLARSDADGNFFWKKTASTSDLGFATQILPLPDQSVLMVASSFPPTTQGFPNVGDDNQLWLLKLRKTGIVSSENLKKDIVFEVFPNPISENQTLQILLENDNFGKVKIEVLSLDGRLISIFEKEKTAQNQVFEINDLPKMAAFLVRVSDGKTSARRLVLKF